MCKTVEGTADFCCEVDEVDEVAEGGRGRGEPMPLLVDQARWRLAGRVKTFFVAEKPRLVLLLVVIVGFWRVRCYKMRDEDHRAEPLLAGVWCTYTIHHGCSSLHSPTSTIRKSRCFVIQPNACSSRHKGALPSMAARRRERESSRETHGPNETQ